MFTFINEKDMPSCLLCAHFDEWHKKFNVSLQAIGLPEFLPIHLNVAFSDEEETNRYGSLTIDEVKDLIRETWGEDQAVEDILQRIHSETDYREQIQALMEILGRRQVAGENVPNPEILYAYLQDLEFDVPVLGRYYCKERQIILFVKNIEKAAAEHKNLPEHEFEKVFIHELFHAYHYVDPYGEDREELLQRWDYTSKVVKESLASAFEWNYCTENHIAGGDTLRKSWLTHSVRVYPYSGARQLLEEAGRFTGCFLLDRKKFCQVFETSLLDMDGALRCLLTAFDFYKIKNTVLVREKIVEKKAASAMTRADFDAKMSGKRVGEIAREQIPPIVAKKPHLVSDLLDLAYSQTAFGISAAVLSTTQEFYLCGDRIYYANMKVHTGGRAYYLFMHWREKHRQDLLNWLWIHLM